MPLLKFPVHIVDENGLPNTFFKLSVCIAHIKEIKIFTTILNLSIGILLTIKTTIISIKRIICC